MGTSSTDANPVDDIECTGTVTHAGNERVLTGAQALAILAAALVPIAAWPGIGDPFATPRIWILAAATTAIVGVLAIGRTPVPAQDARLRAVSAWLAALGLSAAFAPLVSLDVLVQELLVVAWAGALAWAAPPPSRVAAALRVAAGIVAAWAVLQWLGMDPWALVGWQPVRAYGPRMRVYATLGNPNYVGALLVALLPIAALPLVAGPRRWASIALTVLVAAAIAATGSRGAWLGAAAGVAWLMLSGAVAGRVLALALVMGVALVGTGIALGPARGLGETLRGRTYIWGVTVPHLLGHPLTGWGPGSFAVTYPEWELERLEQGVDRDVRTYAAAQRHAHNDYVERLSDLGVPGLLAWCAIVGGVLVASVRSGAAGREQAIAAAAAAGVAALAAVSLVDFPLQRPAERFTWWTLAVLATTAGTRYQDSQRT